jgi:hypothetical protein
VAADTLTDLDVSHSSLGDVALGPLFDALPAVTRLHSLRCVYEHDERHLSDAFIRDRVMPALRANGSLRVLCLGEDDDQRPCVLEAEALVNSRTD